MARKRRILVLVSSLILASIMVLGTTSLIERRKVRAAAQQLNWACENSHWDEAYLMMSQEYRKRVSLEDFRSDVGEAMFGPNAIGWPNFGRCSVWHESGGLFVGYIWTFRKEDGVWRCDSHGDTWYLD